MPHYKLPSPANANAPLTKRGARWDATIYHCTATNTFWLLHMDRNGNRFLYAYLIDGEKPVVDKSQKHTVPEDWTGDPETITVDLEIIQDSASQKPDAVNLPSGLERMLDNGDRVLVTDSDNTVIGEVVKVNGVIAMRRKQGFGVN